MSGLFIKILNLSFAASFLIVACILVRFAFKKMPKYVRILLWLLVAVRLLVPFEIESPLSLQPAKTYVKVDQGFTSVDQMEAEIDSAHQAVTQQAVLQREDTAQVATAAEESGAQMDISGRGVYDVLAVVWIIGAAAFIIYGFAMYARLKYCVRDAVRVTPNVYQTDRIVSPFVLGIFRARIYMPYNLTLKEQFFVMNHEQAHIKRKDHLIKPAAFAVAAIYWFNPLVWVAYVLLCRDIEFACDEKVIERIGYNMKKEYSQSILDLSVPRRYIAACPVAFGETGVKERVRNILNMKKTKKIVLITAVLAVAAVGIGFMTYPKKDNTEKEKATEAVEVTEEVTEEVASVETTETEATEAETTEEATSPTKVDVDVTQNSEKTTITIDGETLELDEASKEGSVISFVLKDGEWEPISDGDNTVKVVQKEDGSSVLYITYEGDGDTKESTYSYEAYDDEESPIIIVNGGYEESEPIVEDEELSDEGVEQPEEAPPVEED